MSKTDLNIRVSEAWVDKIIDLVKKLDSSPTPTIDTQYLIGYVSAAKEFVEES